jgi:hypothetical protein
VKGGGIFETKLPRRQFLHLTAGGAALLSITDGVIEWILFAALHE